MKRYLTVGMLIAAPPLLTSSCATATDGQVLIGQDCDPGFCDAGAPSFTQPSPSEDGQAAPVEPTQPVMCIATECPYPYATCAKPYGLIPYKCETNLLIDDNNCGACGNVCSGPDRFPDFHVITQCIDGACRFRCEPGYQDCNDLVDDGCEVRTIDDVDNCGKCDNRCPDFTNGERKCDKGKCADQCSLPWTWCPEQHLCTDIEQDGNNCGACGNVCPTPPPAPPHMSYACSEGQCGQLGCLNFWSDCNNDIDGDGCETNIIGDPNNCGGCGNVCEPGQLCLLGKYGLPTCACGYHETLCNGNDLSGNYCADLLSDIDNCGACGYSCRAEGRSLGKAECHNGYCETECLPGWGDCDKDMSNGCETNLLLNQLHCGACENRCDLASSQPCLNGKCLMIECDGGAVAR